MRVTVLRRPGLTSRQRSIVSAAGIGPLLRRAGARLGVPPRTSLTVLMTDDTELRSLNRRHLGHDAATDVLAFPAQARGILGDVAISVERAMAQAPADPAAELSLLAVHGMLHCMGHDHAERNDAARMTQATRELLSGQDVPDLEPA